MSSAEILATAALIFGVVPHLLRYGKDRRAVERDERRDAFNSLKAVVARYDADVTKLRAENAALEVRLESIQESFAKLQAQVEELRRQLRLRDERIEELEKKLGEAA